MIVFLRHIAIEGPGTLGTFFENAGFKTRVIDLKAGDKIPSSFKGIEAVVSLGGPMNVYEEARYPFLARENSFLQELIAREVPFLGVCLGAQLLAKAAGARVVKSPQKEIGFFDVQLTPSGAKDAFFAGIRSPWKVFQWHEDSFEVPGEGVLLARSKRCPRQAFRVGGKAYGLQFHAEVSGAMIAQWFRCYGAQEKPENARKAKAVLARYQDIKKEFHEQAQILYRNFFSLID